VNEAAKLAVKKDKDSYSIGDGAKIVTENIRCSNGIIHVIDKVLLPPAT
jgi:uncharacterized surface protein with fasciclin (FAS1) repeats